MSQKPDECRALPTMLFNAFTNSSLGTQPLKLKNKEQDCYIWPQYTWSPAFLFFLSLCFFLPWRYFPLWYQLTYMCLGPPKRTLSAHLSVQLQSLTHPAQTGQCLPNILCVPKNISRIQTTVFDSGHPSGFQGSTALSVTQMWALRVTCPLYSSAPSQVVFLTGAIQVQAFGALVWTVGIAF